MTAEYLQYLASADWRQRRDNVILRDRFLCQGCLKARAAEVHHLTYEHKGQEFAWELVSLCKACHERVHVIKTGPGTGNE